MRHIAAWATRHKTIVVGALVAATVPVLDALTSFDPAQITDWRAWAVGLGAASVRQAAVWALAQIAASRIVGAGERNADRA